MDWNKRKRFTAGLSVVSNTVLVLGKFIVGFAIGSVSVISEAVHSSVDLMAAIVAFIAVGESSKPPDKKHPFGHGKAEGISGAFEGLLIFLAIIIIVIESVKRIISGGEIHRVDWGLAVMAVSAIMNAIVSRQLFKVSKKTDSLALEADALHLSTDVLTSAGGFCRFASNKIYRNRLA
ncbi:MAG: cation diffusion facilitator family transporter [candidate division Zixibacteria bacterium]|nr:cation diffusion facilitator family transporter [candidate division Zixibacteria bacterium]